MEGAGAMDSILKGVGDALIALGLPGIIIIALGYGVFRLFGLYTEVQEKRIGEGRETVKAIEENTSALDRLTDLIRDRSDRRGDSH